MAIETEAVVLDYCKAKQCNWRYVAEVSSLDCIQLHNRCAVLGQAGGVGPIEFLVRNWHDVLFEFESERILLANKVCRDW